MGGGGSSPGVVGEACGSPWAPRCGVRFAAQSREGPSAGGSGVEGWHGEVEGRGSLDVACVVTSRDWNGAWDPDTREGGGVGLNVERNLPGESFFIGYTFTFRHYASKSPA